MPNAQRNGPILTKKSGDERCDARPFVPILQLHIVVAGSTLDLIWCAHKCTGRIDGRLQRFLNSIKILKKNSDDTESRVLSGSKDRVF